MRKSASLRKRRTSAAKAALKNTALTVSFDCASMIVLRAGSEAVPLSKTNSTIASASLLSNFGQRNPFLDSGWFLFFLQIIDMKQRSGL
jgi:hypothetical protein